MGSASYDAWTRARPANDFATMRPYLEKALDFSREYADFFAPYEHIADPLIDGPDEGMTTAPACARCSPSCARELVPIVRAIAEQPVADDCLPARRFPEAQQLDVRPRSRVKRFGYDFERGRLDKTHHPFCTKFASGDVRITTRVRENDLGEALFSTLHEAGHALYEQGVDAALEGTPLELRRLRRRAREPVAAVGERGRPQPRLLGALLSGAARGLPRAVRQACRSTPSIAPSTRSSAR